MRARAIIGLVVETRCRYAQSASYPDPIKVGPAIERLGTSSVTYRSGAFQPEVAEAAARASFIHVYVDRAKRRPVSLPTP